MASNFFRIDGLPVTPAVARDYLRLKADHDKNCPCGVPLRVKSGWRSKQDQHDIFVKRYRKGARSPWGDYRWYQGARWGRVSGAGTVMSPDDVSNHTLGYALDLNITQGGVCQRWMLANAGKYKFNWVEGKSAKEPWHWVWHVTFRPNKSTPDPWDGRGMPRSAPKSDPGMTLEQLYGKTKPTPKPNNPTTATPDESEEDDDMALKGAFYTRKADGKDTYLLFNDNSGFYVEHSGVKPGEYNNPLAQHWNTGSWPKITEAHANVIKRALDTVRRTAVTGSLSVDIDAA